MEYNNRTSKQAVIKSIIDRINDYEGTEVSELHNNLFNTDYWVIGYYQAEQEILKNDFSVFEAIGIIQKYEESNFGEVTTQLDSSEHVCNMLFYILGEEVLNSLDLVSNNYDETLTPELIDDIIEILESKK